MKEKDVARQIDDMLRLNGARVWPIKEPFCPHCRRFTGTPLQAGIPDRFVVLPSVGISFWLELKRPGGRIRLKQEEFIAAVKPTMFALIASSWEEVRDHIEAYAGTCLKVRG